VEGAQEIGQDSVKMVTTALENLMKKWDAALNHVQLTVAGVHSRILKGIVGPGSGNQTVQQDRGMGLTVLASLGLLENLETLGAK